MSQSTAVTADHLRRLACLYVRQSSLQQVRDHPESTARQYALKRRALALGWAADRIVVIDDDLGISGASAAERTGFQRVVADVGLGRVGVVMGLEVSRLARNSSDWHRLLEICALSETLILDEDGLYDPAHFNDRLLLGLKGTMSEAELHVLRARLIGGQLNKARRGELWIRPPLGFVVDPAGKLILDPDEQVQSAVRLVFGTFGRTGSAGAVVRYFQQQQVAWPQRVIKGLRAGVLVFGELERHRVLDILPAVGTRPRRRRRMGLVNPRRAAAASLPPVPCTGPAAWAPAAPLRPVLGEGRGLPSARAAGGGELLLEVFATTLPPVPVAGGAHQVTVGARQVVDQFGVLPLELLNALVPRILLSPERLRTAASAALASHAPRIGSCAPNLHSTSRIFSPLPGNQRPIFLAWTRSRTNFNSITSLYAASKKSIRVLDPA